LRGGTHISPESVAVYCGAAFIASLFVFQWYQTSSPISRFYSIRDASALLKACVLIAMLSSVVAFLLTRLEDAPRSIPILHLMLLTSGLLGARVILRLLNTRRETIAATNITEVEHVVIIAASRLAWFFTKMIEELAPGRYQIVAILDEQPKLKHRSLNGYPIIGGPLELDKVIADYAIHGVHVDKVILAARREDLRIASWNEVFHVCQTRNIGLQILPDRLMSQEAVARTELSLRTELETAMVVKTTLLLNRPFWKVKRVIDLLIALIVLILTSPITIVLCALVLLDVGIPAVFWQRRVGRNGAPLHLYKFRTLHTLFDRQTKVRREAQQPSPLGRLLQRTRLDELPQLWNIIFGDMSLIGPRPLLPVDQPEDHSVRLSVRPGLTGWAQVCGGKLITADEKTALDEWYIRHASFWLDARITLKTMRMLMTGDRRDENAILLALDEKSQLNTISSPAHEILKRAFYGNTTGEEAEVVLSR
jgi:lipopolysaccharide/colanic/teichoic acid biosynthesis glycosyltransferase